VNLIINSQETYALLSREFVRAPIREIRRIFLPCESTAFKFRRRGENGNCVGERYAVQQSLKIYPVSRRSSATIAVGCTYVYYVIVRSEVCAALAPFPSNCANWRDCFITTFSTASTASAFGSNLESKYLSPKFERTVVVVAFSRETSSEEKVVALFKKRTKIIKIFK